MYNDLPGVLGSLNFPEQTSTALEIARTAARIALTFVPILVLKNYKSRRWLKHLAIHGKTDGVIGEEKRTRLIKGIRQRSIAFHALLLVPAVLFWATIVASLERTPLTGRCDAISS